MYQISLQLFHMIFSSYLKGTIIETKVFFRNNNPKRRKFGNHCAVHFIEHHFIKSEFENFNVLMKCNPNKITHIDGPKSQKKNPQAFVLMKFVQVVLSIIAQCNVEICRSGCNKSLFF